ncbi:unnamed protein product [Protopolystoma xenopodis]|uniref:WH1 domain-containing protein n=1 Tax=Protopolystoma xenopodis TaxID=117903 RepID=A0A448WPT5_9PLAT|nr:unnamed protein product [Protopolystoma xenopodis]
MTELQLKALFGAKSPGKSYLTYVQQNRLLFQQELYDEMEYTRPLDQFHVMHGDSGPIGLSFADRSEADRFGCMVIERLSRQRTPRSHTISTNKIVTNIGNKSTNLITGPSDICIPTKDKAYSKRSNKTQKASVIHGCKPHKLL